MSVDGNDSSVPYVTPPRATFSLTLFTSIGDPLAVDECASLVPQRALDLRDVRDLTAEQDRLHGVVGRLEPCRLHEYLLRFRWSDDHDSVRVGDDDVAGVDDDSAARDRHVDLAGASDRAHDRGDAAGESGEAVLLDLARVAHGSVGNKTGEPAMHQPTANISANERPIERATRVDDEHVTNLGLLHSDLHHVERARRRGDRASRSDDPPDRAEDRLAAAVPGCR